MLCTDSFLRLCVTENPNFTTEWYVDADDLLVEAISLDLSERAHQIKPHQDITFDNKYRNWTIPLPICRHGCGIVSMPPPILPHPQHAFWPESMSWLGRIENVESVRIEAANSDKNALVCLVYSLVNSIREGIWKLSLFPKHMVLLSLVAQMIKNPPAVRETWVPSLGREDPLEEDMATHSSILAWRVPTDRGAWWATVHGVAKSWTRLSN